MSLNLRNLQIHTKPSQIHLRTPQRQTRSPQRQKLTTAVLSHPAGDGRVEKDESPRRSRRAKRQIRATTGAWSGRKSVSICQLYKVYQIWMIHLQCTDGHCWFLQNDQMSSELGSARKHKEQQAAEDVAAADPLVGRRFPELQDIGQTFLDENSFRSLWTATSPAHRHGLCTFIQANFSSAFKEEQQKAPWLETWLKRGNCHHTIRLQTNRQLLSSNAHPGVSHVCRWQ